MKALDRESLEAAIGRTSRRWLVTGAAGFIGSHLCERLLELDQEVLALDDLSSGCEANWSAFAGHPRFHIRRGDVRCTSDVQAACAGVEFVLHQAARGSAPRSLADPAGTLAVNARGTWNVLGAARAAGARRVVYASSSSVYGDVPGLPWSEEDLGHPLSPYAASKRSAELAAQGLWRATGFEAVGLRYFNVIGPRQAPAGPYAAVVPRWCAALASGELPEIHGDGTTTRDFTPVELVVEANLRAALAPLTELPAGASAVCNVGTGLETTLADLARALMTACAEAGGPVGARTLRHGPERPLDRRRSRADTTRARRWLGLDPSSASGTLAASVAEALREALRR